MYNTKILGQIGENLIKHLLEENGVKVKMSTDPYDQNKDLLADNKTVEVKLQAPWFIKHWLTFGSNQESKLRNVDQLYVIGYNNTNKKCFNWANKIWYIKNSFQKISYINPKTGKSMFAINLYDPAVFEVADTPDEIVKMCTKYTTSTFK